MGDTHLQHKDIEIVAKIIVAQFLRNKLSNQTNASENCKKKAPVQGTSE